MTRTLVHAGASVYARDREGHTSLMWVISKNNVPHEADRIANELIDAGADVEARDNKGQTLLYWVSGDCRPARCGPPERQ